MDINMIKGGDSFFRSTQGPLSHRNEGRDVAIYLRNGSIWVGHFIDSRGELNFGDDRLDAAHGLGDLVHSEVLEAAHIGNGS
jgi:hypothetical protein